MKAGDASTRKISTNAETKAGKATAEVRIRFTITGSTFTGGEKAATILINTTGVAVAPPCRRATVPAPRLPRGRPRIRRNLEPCNCE